MKLILGVHKLISLSCVFLKIFLLTWTPALKEKQLYMATTRKKTKRRNVSRVIFSIYIWYVKKDNKVEQFYWNFCKRGVLKDLGVVWKEDKELTGLMSGLFSSAVEISKVWNSTISNDR